MSGYIPNVPLSNQSLGQTQPTINTNFTILNTNMGSDHVDFTNIAPPSGNGGYHNKSTLVQQGSDPTAVSGADILYSKSVTYPGPVSFTELFLRRASGDGGAIIQMSNNTPVASSKGFTFLPGGILLQWSTGTASTGGTANTFQVPFPTACWGVTLSIQSSSVSSLHSVWCSTNPPSTTAFTAKSDGGSLAIFYFAVGN